LVVSSPGHSAGGNTGRAYIFYNDGTIPTTAATADVMITGTTAGDLFGSDFAVGDFNTDNRIDLAVTAYGHSSSTGRTYIFYNDGTIPTTAATADVMITGTTSGDFFGKRVIAGDFNADTRTDLISMAPGTAAAAYIFYNDGTIPTTAATADVTITGITGSTGSDMAAGDFNADSKTDFAFTISDSVDPSSLYIFYNDGSIPTSTASADVYIPISSIATTRLSLAAQDINTDGRVDIVFSDGGGTNSVYVFYNDGSYPASSSLADKVYTGASSSYGAAVHIMDINLDGKPDVIVSDTSDSSSKGIVYSYISETSYIPDLPTSATFRGDIIMRGDNTVR
ncbi:MAG: VCBS repeat-containing protein, partial [Candidatus Moranbacteria bacterium]|nr:VCBS repeat-containing protein [Candidatus Moranbacteria bacterium]